MTIFHSEVPFRMTMSGTGLAFSRQQKWPKCFRVLLGIHRCLRQPFIHLSRHCQALGGQREFMPIFGRRFLSPHIVSRRSFFRVVGLQKFPALCSMGNHPTAVPMMRRRRLLRRQCKWCLGIWPAGGCGCKSVVAWTFVAPVEGAFFEGSSRSLGFAHQEALNLIISSQPPSVFSILSVFCKCPKAVSPWDLLYCDVGLLAFWVCKLSSSSCTTRKSFDLMTRVRDIQKIQFFHTWKGTRFAAFEIQLRQKWNSLKLACQLHSLNLESSVEASFVALLKGK